MYNDNINIKNCVSTSVKEMDFVTLPGKMLLVGIIENNKIDAYSRSGRLSKG